MVLKSRITGRYRRAFEINQGKTMSNLVDIFLQPTKPIQWPSTTFIEGNAFRALEVLNQSPKLK
jgi:hypothetical protein